MPKSAEQLKQEYVNSLDSFIEQNPTVGQLNTSDFRDFLIGLVGHESSYNPTARQGSYFGWYQTNKRDLDPYKQHMNAFNHLNYLFNNTITKDDVMKSRELGINDSALMLKYWNQGNRVNNYLWNGWDYSDGLGTKISNYGNDLESSLNVFDYAMDNLYGDYVVKNGDIWDNIQKRVRIPGRNYNTGGKDLWTAQRLNGRPFGSLKIGQSFKFGERQQAYKDEEEQLNNRKIDDKSNYLLELSDRVRKQQGIKYLTNYQKGGSLVYTSFLPETINKEESEYKNSELEDNARYPVQPVAIYTPVQYDIKNKKLNSNDVIENLSVNGANNDNLNRINSELKNAGYKKTQRAAILATIVAESGANSTAIGDAGKARGLFQWHPNRFNAGIDLDSQIQLLLTEIKDRNNANAWTSSRKYNKDAAYDLFHNTEDLNEAISILTSNYIRPANTDREIAKRYNIAQQLISQMV